MHTAVLGLETAGLLTRRPKNHRVVLVRPTDLGLTTLKTATPRVRAVERAAVAGLSRNDERAVRTWLAENVPDGITARPRSFEESRAIYLKRRMESAYGKPGGNEPEIAF